MNELSADELVIDRQAAINEPTLPSLTQLTHWVGCVFAHHVDDQRREVTIRFVDEEESQTLNCWRNWVFPIRMQAPPLMRFLTKHFAMNHLLMVR